MGPLIFYPEGVASHFIRESMQWRDGPDIIGGLDLPKWPSLLRVKSAISSLIMIPD